LCLTVFLSLLAWQLFLPPVTGLSDNNDFSKVLGPAHICIASRDNLNSYFVTGYAAGPQCQWSGGFTSSEILFVDLARYLSRPFTGRYYFDLRASAAVHVAVLAGAMALFLRITRRQRPLVRFLLPPLAILMFTDVAYAAYLNSAYMDNASWVLLLLLAAIAAAACTGPEKARQWLAPCYGLTGLLLVFSKAQHAVLGVPFAGLAVWFAWRNREPVQRAVWMVCAVGLLASMAVMPRLTPPEYQNISLYNLIFYRLAPADRKVLDQLGLDSEYQKWIGSQAFAANSPLPDPDWTRRFVAQVSFFDIAMLYVRRPGIALREIDRELRDSVHSMRPDYMANYRQADGFPPHSVATRFSFWSDLKMRTVTRYPYLLLFLYGVPFLGAFWRSPGVPLAVTLAVAGISEFALCSLADAIDTHRHMFLFHIVTDSMILLTVAWLLAGRRGRSAELP